jgi:hypothetical protein
MGAEAPACPSPFDKEEAPRWESLQASEARSTTRISHQNQCLLFLGTTAAGTAESVEEGKPEDVIILEGRCEDKCNTAKVQRLQIQAHFDRRTLRGIQERRLSWKP